MYRSEKAGYMTASSTAVSNRVSPCNTGASIHDNAGILIGLATALGAVGRSATAIAKVERALTTEPQSIAALTVLGALLVESGRYAAARRAFERLLELDPDRAQTHADLALLHDAEGQSEQARGAALRALDLEATNATANRLLAQLDGGEGDWIGAKKQLKELLAQRDDALAWFELGRVHERLGDYEGAITAFTKGNKLHARQPQARHYGLDAYCARESPGEEDDMS